MEVITKKMEDTKVKTDTTRYNFFSKKYSVKISSLFFTYREGTVKKDIMTAVITKMITVKKEVTKKEVIIKKTRVIRTTAVTTNITHMIQDIVKKEGNLVKKVGHLNLVAVMVVADMEEVDTEVTGEGDMVVVVAEDTVVEVVEVTKAVVVEVEATVVMVAEAEVTEVEVTVIMILINIIEVVIFFQKERNCYSRDSANILWEIKRIRGCN